MPAKKKKDNVEGGPQGGGERTPKGDSVSLFTLAVVTIVILGVIGIVFGYTKDKLNELQGGGNAAALEEQIINLKNQLKDLSDKTLALEKLNAENKEIVASLFDKNRKLPASVDSSTWVNYTNSEAKVNLKLPETWEVVSAQKVASGSTPAPAEGEAAADTPVLHEFQYIIMLQSKGELNFVQAVTIKDDYLDFAGLTLAEKYDIFKELNLLDERDLSFGKMLYFIDLDDAENEIPTVLILTENRILRATFNVYNKAFDKYIQFRQDFEAMMTTIDLAAKTEDAAKTDVPAAPAE